MSVSNASLKPQTKKITQIMKIAVPHIGLYLLIFCYLMIGAWAFRRLEYQAEFAYQQDRLSKIEDVYRQITNALSDECTDFSEERLYNSLSRLSTFMEGKPFQLSPTANDVREIMTLKWDFTSSVLYALSILTTTGFGLSPMTMTGKFLTIAYGFLGFSEPGFMFLAAIDLGRFLSEVVLKVYAKAEQAASLCGCPRKTDVISQVETKALKVLTPIKRRSITRTFGKKSKKKEKEPNKKRLPLLVYTAAGGSQKNFIGAFFVTFNLVAKFGLAILAMCAELAVVELKWLFIKIHYFGRKINWKRKSAAVKTDEQMEVELKELLKIITQIRAKHPEKKEITSIDILKYVEELNTFNQYLTFNMFLQNRRSTLAFMPSTIEELMFADEALEETASLNAEEKKLDTILNISNGLDFSDVPYDV